MQHQDAYNGCKCYSLSEDVTLQKGAITNIQQIKALCNQQFGHPMDPGDGHVLRFSSLHKFS